MSALKHKKPKLTLILILSFLFCAAAIIFMINELLQNQIYFTRSFGKEQELLVAQIAKQAKDMLIENPGSDKKVIEKVIMSSETSGNRYWFFIKENELIFLKNNFEMEQLKEKDVADILHSFKAAGGYKIDELITFLENKANGTVLLSRSRTEKNILASVSFFQVNKTNYSLGMCTTENYILSAGKIFKHNTYSIMVIVLVCMVLFAAMIICMLVISKNDEEILFNNKTIHAKNIKIEELVEKNNKPDIMFNSLTKLYGKEVLYALLKKVNQPKLLPFSMLVIKLDFSENITYDDLLLELTPELHKILPKNSVATRAQENQIAILFFKTEYTRAKAYQGKLLKAWSRILQKLQTSVQTDVITQFVGQDVPIDVFEFWVKANQQTKGNK